MKKELDVIISVPSWFNEKTANYEYDNNGDDWTKNQIEPMIGIALRRLIGICVPKREEYYHAYRIKKTIGGVNRKASNCKAVLASAYFFGPDAYMLDRNKFRARHKSSHCNNLEAVIVKEHWMFIKDFILKALQGGRKLHLNNSELKYLQKISKDMPNKDKVKLLPFCKCHGTRLIVDKEKKEKHSELKTLALNKMSKAVNDFKWTKLSKAKQGLLPFDEPVKKKRMFVHVLSIYDYSESNEPIEDYSGIYNSESAARKALTRHAEVYWKDKFIDDFEWLTAFDTNDARVCAFFELSDTFYSPYWCIREKWRKEKHKLAYTLKQVEVKTADDVESEF